MIFLSCFFDLIRKYIVEILSDEKGCNILIGKFDI